MGISRGMPALVYARKVQQRAAGIGFEYPDVAGALADLDDELRELRAELHHLSAHARLQHHLARRLQAAVEQARADGGAAWVDRRPPGW